MAKSPAEITQDMLSAWDEEVPPETPPEEPETETEEPETETEEEEEEEEEVSVGKAEVPAPPSEPQPEEQEEETEEEEAEETEEEGAVSGDPEVAAFLARYGGDREKALKGAADLVRLMNRQGQEKNQAIQRAMELEAQLQQAQAQAQMPSSQILNNEQREWVEQAVESDNVPGYVQAAVQANEFTVARALCDAAAESDPYTAGRLANYVDQAEQYAALAWQQQQMAQQAPQVNHSTLMNVLVDHFPEMPQYEQQMLSTLQTLGENHPLVQDARSPDPETAARGIIGVFEIARATAAQVATTRSKVQRQKRAEGDAARGAAVVSSAKATPASAETPRTVQIAPGLTLDQLDAAWEQ